MELETRPSPGARWFKLEYVRAKMPPVEVQSWQDKDHITPEMANGYTYERVQWYSAGTGLSPIAAVTRVKQVTEDMDQLWEENA